MDTTEAPIELVERTKTDAKAARRISRKDRRAKELRERAVRRPVIPGKRLDYPVF